MSKRRPSKEQIRLRRESIAWYLGLSLLVGQIAAHIALGVSFYAIAMIITGVVIIVPLFGTDFVIELVKALRGGSASEGGSEDGNDPG